MKLGIEATDKLENKRFPIYLWYPVPSQSSPGRMVEEK